MITDYLALGNNEIVNSARLRAYVDSIGSPIILGDCSCAAFTNEIVGDAPYTTPGDPASPAPWYDPDVPASAEFAGVLLLDAAGIDDNPLSRTVTQAAQGSAAFGPAREQPLTITLDMLVIGSTCCGAQYGLKWLAAALQGCVGTGCGGDCATMYECCPPSEGPVDPAAFNAAHRRTFRRVALTQGPTVMAREGGICGGAGCGGGNGEVIRVEVILTAATPWAWKDTLPLLAVDLPTDDGECIVWCVHGGPGSPVCIDPLPDNCGPGAVSVEMTEDPCDPGSVVWPDRSELGIVCDQPCRLRACPDDRGGCSDPRCQPATPPSVGASSTCFCEALAVNQAWYELDLTAQPQWFGSAPIIEVFAGATPLRNLSIRIFERRSQHLGLTCEEVAQVERCNPHAVYNVAYVPAEGTVTIDGQIGRAFVDCGGTCAPSADTHGAAGGPLQTPLMDCDKYCVEISSDALNVPAVDSQLSFSISGRQY